MHHHYYSVLFVSRHEATRRVRQRERNVAWVVALAAADCREEV